MMKKSFVGVRLRRLRQERGLTQAAMARTLGISPSYLNQMEQNQRPLTVQVLLRISSEMGADMQRFSDSDEAHLIAALREVAPDLPHYACATGTAHSGGHAGLGDVEIRELVGNMPDVARALLGLYESNRQLAERVALLGQQGGADDERHGIEPGAAHALPASAHEEVRDFFYARNNHIAELDDAAETFAANWQLPAGAMAEATLGEHLARRHGVRVLTPPLQASADAQPGEEEGTVRSFDPHTRTLLLSPFLAGGQRAFQLATQFALLEMGEPMERQLQGAVFQRPQATSLARLGLAHYFAGALLLPYTQFLHTARHCAHDLELLACHYGVGFETICHRLSTLQRAHNRGIPFFFVRVDRAGNISKRQSATHFHFSRIGGTCPLWTVYDAFTQPGRIAVQIARMPDGRTYFWVARTVHGKGSGWARAGKIFSVALGCDIRHAHEMVYAQGMDLSRLAPVPIGMGCKVCERKACAQRAFPSIGQSLQVDENRSWLQPYR